MDDLAFLLSLLQIIHHFSTIRYSYNSSYAVTTYRSRLKYGCYKLALHYTHVLP